MKEEEKEVGMAADQTEVSAVKALEKGQDTMMITVQKMSGVKKKGMNMVIIRMRDPEIEVKTEEEDKDTENMMIPMMRGLKMKESHE